MLRVVASLGTTKRFYSNRNYLYFPENLFTKKVKDSRESARRWEALHSESASASASASGRFTCFRRDDSRKYLNERIFARDGAVPRFLHRLLFIEQKVNVLDNGSIRCRL